MSKRVKEDRKLKKVKNDKLNMIYVFSKATDLAFAITLIPVASLLFGVFLDKRFSTMPLFTIIGALAAISLSIYKIVRLKNKLIKT